MNRFGIVGMLLHADIRPVQLTRRVGDACLTGKYMLSHIDDVAAGRSLDSQGGVHYCQQWCLDLEEAARQIDEGEALGDADIMRVVLTAVQTQRSFNRPQDDLRQLAAWLEAMAAGEQIGGQQLVRLAAFFGGLVTAANELAASWTQVQSLHDHLKEQMVGVGAAFAAAEADLLSGAHWQLPAVLNG